MKEKHQELAEAHVTERANKKAKKVKKQKLALTSNEIDD